MIVAIVVAVVVAAYGAGTLPVARWVGRARGFDPTTAGSGNPGASNAWRVGGRAAGAVVLVGDVSKGALPTLAGAAVGGRPLAVAAGMAAVLGHVAPPGRRGGKGVATLLGVLVVVAPLAALVGAAVWAAVTAATRVPALGSMALLVTALATLAVVHAPVGELAVFLAAGLVVVVRHRGNLGRLRSGGEEERPICNGPVPTTRGHR